MPTLQEWKVFLFDLDEKDIDFDLTVDLGEGYGDVSVVIPPVAPPVTPPVTPPPTPQIKDKWLVDTTGKNNTRVKVRPEPSFTVGEQDYVYNGELLEGPEGKRSGEFVFIDDRVSPDTHIVAGWVEVQYLRYQSA